MATNDGDARIGKQRKRGYALTLSVVLLFSVVALFVLGSNALKMRHVARTLEAFGTEKISYITDDVTDDLRHILSYDRRGPWLTFVENLTYNKTTFLSGYSSFLEKYSNTTGVNASIAYGDPLEIRFTDGLVYRSNFSNQRIDFYNASGGPTGINKYEFHIVSNTSRAAYLQPDWTADGIYLYVNYTDPDPVKSFILEGYLDPTVLNTLTIDFPGAAQTTYIHVGLIDGRQEAARLEQIAILTYTSVDFRANRTADYPTTAAYNVRLNASFLNSNFSAGVPA